jgi:putative CocE/NonD family hydrolase
VRFVDVSRIRSRFVQSVVARDGTSLSVDLYLPPDKGRYPALITRTPYDNNRLKRANDGTTLLASPADRYKKLAAHGFAVAACDVRGRGDSGGSFLPYAHEAQDGADTVDWVRGLAECDGRIGLFGSGYAGFTALAAATHTAVDAVAVWSPFGREGTPYRGGALRLDWLLWMHLIGGRTLQPVDVPDWLQVFRHRPTASMHKELGREDIWWADWLNRAPELESLDLSASLSSLDAPTLFVTGWWDSASSTTIRYWEAASSSSTQHALIVGPWDDKATREPRESVGGIAWGPRSVLDPEELLVEWFSNTLRGTATPRRGAKVFVTGRNEWTSTEASGQPKTLWLASGGRANTRNGDGLLVSSVPKEGTPDRFVHNPDQPVPWQPHGGSFSRSAGVDFTLDTSFATSRDDVLVFTGEPEVSAVLIVGRPLAWLWVESESEDADWFVSIEDVFPGGSRSMHLAHGVVRAAAREPVEIEVELTPLAHELLPGHSLRVCVASSLWPLYAVNLGGADYLHDTEPRISEHAVHHDSRYPSRVELRVAEDWARYAPLG